jgi:hypothetical protein
MYAFFAGTAALKSHCTMLSPWVCKSLKCWYPITTCSITTHKNSTWICIQAPLTSPWRWRQQDPPKRSYLITAQETSTWSVSVVAIGKCKFTCDRIPTFRRTLLRPSSRWSEWSLVADWGRGLLGCDAVWCCERIPTFRTTLLPPSSGWSEWSLDRDSRRGLYGLWRRVVLW